MSDLAEFLTEEPLSRAAPVVDFNQAEGIVEAKLAAYEVEVDIFSDLSEVFARGAFARSAKLPGRVKVSDQQHNRMVVIGHAVELRDEADGLYGLLKIADTSAGRDTLTLLRDGVLDELSVEFVPQAKYMKVTRNKDGKTHVRHERATLIGVSPVSEGAYGQAAKVLKVRANQMLTEADENAAEQAELAARQLAEIRAKHIQDLRGLSS
jgi:HK97 family phage prohead protease